MNLHIYTDFNNLTFKRFLESLDVKPFERVICSEYNQFFQALDLNHSHLSDIAFIWALPENLLSSFSKLLLREHIDHESCINELDQFLIKIEDLSKKFKFLFFVNFPMISRYRTYGLIDWDYDIGVFSLLSKFNLLISKRLSRKSNTFILDSNNWEINIDSELNKKTWYLTKVPYSINTFRKASENLISSLNVISGKSKKLVILDLDNTLWGGVVGDLGIGSINLGGHNFEGEAFKDFQIFLYGLYNQGIQLAICSKNDEDLALKTIQENEEMVLKKEFFITWRINWNDKASNILEIAKELNLGLDSIVFIDDNPVERDLVQKLLPDVEVPDMPKDIISYISFIRNKGYFDQISITEDDRKRAQTYLDNKKRDDLKKEISSKDKWLKELDTKIKINYLSKLNITRVQQLFNKTNQLNLSTRRLSEKELLDWNSSENSKIINFQLKDKFGNMGLIGVLGIYMNNEIGIILDFILSCRAMGRKVEDIMIYIAIKELEKLGAKRIEAEYIMTERNRPTLDIFNESIMKVYGKNKYYFEDFNKLKCPLENIITFEYEK